MDISRGIDKNCFYSRENKQKTKGKTKLFDTKR